MTSSSRILFLLSLLGITVAFIRVGGGGNSFCNEYGGGPHGPPSTTVPTTTVLPKRCPSDWMTFNRTQGIWCAKVFYGTNDWTGAQAACKTQGAVLTGVQDSNERVQVANSAREVSNANGGVLNEMWMDGVRKPECPDAESCEPLDAFKWTDGHTTGTDGFFWPGIEPSAHYDVDLGVQNVTMMHISSFEGQPGSYDYPHGSMDDDFSSIQHNLYACGKLP